jgi:hypothetical protein
MADTESSARVAFEIALWRLQQQIEYGRSLDSKLGSAFALSAAMIALLGSALIFASPVDQQGVGTAVTAAAGLFIANIAVSTVALIIGRLDIGPGGEEVTALASTPDSVSRQDIAGLLSIAEQRNRGVLRMKSMFVGASLLLTSATAIAIAVAAILAV